MFKRHCPIKSREQLARCMVKNEIEMVREGIEGSFHTEAIFL
jgi:hypothetical protein